MFDKGYDFRFVQQDSPKSQDVFVFNYIFKFTAESIRYVVNVEEYKYDFFVIKFYEQQHANLDNRFQLLSQNFNTSKILRTQVDILLYMLEMRPNASFGFRGANLVDEAISSTKRFRIYKGVVSRFFSPITFNHIEDANNSLYLLVNKKNQTRDVANKIIEELKSIYIF